MPVLDHAVHERVRVGADFRYGCRNHPLRTQDFYYSPLATQLVRSVMSKECRYDHSLTDNACQDCTHRGSGEAYSQQVREAGK